MTIDRRAFLGGAVAALASGSLSGCASLATLSVRPVDGRVRLDLAEHPALAEPDAAVRIRAPGWPDNLYVLALGDGEFAVLDPTCTHRGCTVDVEGPRLVCPCHGSTYDREGNVLVGPAERALSPRGTARLRDGVVIVELAGCDDGRRTGPEGPSW